MAPARKAAAVTERAEPPSPTRRRFLGTAARAAATTGLGLAGLVRRSSASGQTLRIAQWAHFVPAYDEWFDQTFPRAWGERNGVKVVVDHVSVGELRARAAGEVAARQGHDLFGFLAPPPEIGRASCRERVFRSV